jgi:hypothetical protein
MNELFHFPSEYTSKLSLRDSLQVYSDRLYFFPCVVQGEPGLERTV